MPNIEEIVQSLKRERDEPFCAYIYDLDFLRQRTSGLVSTLPQRTRLYYAVKANPDPAILQVLASIVSGFEAASLGEIMKIREVSSTIPIIFGGPGKTDSELIGAIHQGVQLIHVESYYELLRLSSIAHQMDTKVSILLRVNLRTAVPTAQLNMAGVPTQFGIDEVDIPKIIQLAQSLSHIDIKGFHFHAMSNNLDAVKHAEFVRHCVEKAKEWKYEYSLNLTTMNVGGGIGVNYNQIEEQFNWDRFSKDLKQICQQDNEHGWEIIFECGRYLTSSCGYYAAEVLDLKKNHGQTFAVLRGGSHHFRLPAAWKQNHPFTIVPVAEWTYPFERPEVRNSLVTIAGELCTPNDVLASQVSVETLKMGDIVLFSYTGAYGWTISHHDFLSHPHPEHIYI